MSIKDAYSGQCEIVSLQYLEYLHFIVIGWLACRCGRGALGDFMGRNLYADLQPHQRAGFDLEALVSQ